ncbi:hypothetical protein A6A20_02130 [Volucribacter amazonae]|uniref:DUF4299 family protein n=2 Tax=Volucribacter amazonae TaxID=256731 RepID=A0A9X4SJT0_9PAST|nr:hypothetical protein [Volucribacter amazonae]
MTPAQVLPLVENLSVYDFPLDEEEYQQLLAAPLSQFVALQLGVEGKSSRCFELAYDDETANYSVRVLTPSTKSDWQIALHFTEQLAKQLKSPIIDEDGNIYHAHISYDYEKDILFGLNVLMNDKNDRPILQGIHHPICFSAEMIENINNADDKLVEFEKVFYENQYVDGYFAKQRFYNNEDKVIGAYSLTQENKTILPFKPEIEWQYLNEISEDDIDKWIITLVSFEDENDGSTYYVLGKLDYHQFIQKLPNDKYRYIDGKYILIEPLSQTELQNFITE